MQRALDTCKAANGGSEEKCVTQAADVLACRGNFLCPAVAQMWTRCYELQVKGKVKAEDCEQAKKALIVRNSQIIVPSCALLA